MIPARLHGLPRWFFDVEIAPFGLELTYEVLLGIVHNFDPDEGSNNALIDAMTELDRVAARDGTADRLLANIIARLGKPEAAVPVLLPTGMDGLPSDFPAMLAACKAPWVARDAAAAIDGWLSPEAADLTIHLCRLQAVMGIRTGVLELGVYRSKDLALLATLHGGTGLPLVGMDLLIERIRQPIAAEHVATIVAGITASVVGAAPDVTLPLIIKARTQDTDSAALLAHCVGGYRFVSVDAGHEADDVATDMALAACLLSLSGIVAPDDALNPALPGVAEGLFQYFRAAEDSRLASIATCGNKLFLCQPEMHTTYLTHAAWLLTQGREAKCLTRSRKRDVGTKQPYLGCHTDWLFGVPC